MVPDWSKKDKWNSEKKLLEFSQEIEQSLESGSTSTWFVKIRQMLKHFKHGVTAIESSSSKTFHDVYAMQLHRPEWSDNFTQERSEFTIDTSTSDAITRAISLMKQGKAVGYDLLPDDSWSRKQIIRQTFENFDFLFN